MSEQQRNDDTPHLAPEHERLWGNFLKELQGDQDWDHDFAPSPFSPERALREFVERAGAAAPPLVGAVSPDDDSRTYWGCVGLTWLGPRAGAEAAAALAALRREMAAGTPGEYPEQLEWLLARVEKPRPSVRERLDRADERFLEGQIEDDEFSAFNGYGDVLFDGPSAHAAFQLAWIDRAFGAEIAPRRVEWIREMGFYDEELLAELARPVVNPLGGVRIDWKAVSFQSNDPARPPRAARAEEAGLPSLAARWSYQERYEIAALDHLDRVWRAVAPRLVAISECDICRALKEVETSFTKIGREDEATTLPPEASRLRGGEVRRCPLCRTFYSHRTYYEFLIGGSEDEEKLKRLTPTQAKALMTDNEYTAILRWMPGNLTHADAKTRRYAAKCMTSYHLERGETASIVPYITHSDPEVALGALILLGDEVDGGEEKKKELWELRDVLARLDDNPHELVAGYARPVGSFLDRFAERAGLI